MQDPKYFRRNIKVEPIDLWIVLLSLALAACGALLILDGIAQMVRP